MYAGASSRPSVFDGMDGHWERSRQMRKVQAKVVVLHHTHAGWPWRFILGVMCVCVANGWVACHDKQSFRLRALPLQALVVFWMSCFTRKYGKLWSEWGTFVEFGACSSGACVHEDAIVVFSCAAFSLGGVLWFVYRVLRFLAMQSARWFFLWHPSQSLTRVGCLTDSGREFWSHAPSHPCCLLGRLDLTWPN